MTLLLLLLLACGGSEPEPNVFPTPWKEGQRTSVTMDGAFTARIGSEHPGNGWFAGNGYEGRDLARASIHTDLDTNWPVLQVQILGRRNQVWDVFEIDIALNRWVAGELAVDGINAVGSLQTVDGDDYYLIGGVIHVEQPGVQDGQLVSGSFENLQFMEVR